MSEGIGNKLHDVSAYQNNGTIYGASWVDGKYGKALDFDGTDDYVEVLNNSSLNPTEAITIAVWIKPDTFPAVGENDRVIRKDFQYVLEFDGNAGGGNNLIFYLRFDFSWITVTSITEFSAGTWYLITATYDRALMKLYINGLLDNTWPETRPIDTFFMNLGIGKMIGIGGYFDGIIDEVRIYNRALTAVEIKKLFRERGYV